MTQHHYLTRCPWLLLWLAFALPFPVFAQTIYTPPVTPRERVQLNGDWRFIAYTKAINVEQPAFDDSAWEAVTLPHTWNSRTNFLTHKAAWYRTHFTLTAADKGKEIFLYFDGAATVAGVYLNGTRLGQHRGAYTRFIFDGTKAANFHGDNVLAVRCDTDPSDTQDCLPAGDGLQLYHVYGGLYRPVWLLKTAPVHVDPMDDAASGVFLSAETLTADSATLAVRTLVRNDSAEPKTVTVTNTVCDENGSIVATLTKSLTCGAHLGLESVARAVIPQPHLWRITDPYLYHIYTETRADSKTTDFVAERTGLRTYSLSASRFLLNGIPTPLRGVAKHQETEERASAVTPEDLTKDWDDLRDLGVNYVRLAHYPHAQLEYDLADERGVVVWAENGHSNPDIPTETGDQITREMIRQNYNHPSIFFWSIGNEALVYNDPDPQTIDRVTLDHYADTARAEDTSRLITYASSTLFHISPAIDFVAVNRYPGWYGDNISDFEPLAVKYHFVSETGGGGVITTHTAAKLPSHKVNIFEPEEYQQELAEARCQTVFRTASAKVPMFTWWTFRDFNDPRYKGFNTKGLETDGGFRKDIFYLFQSFLKPETPVVHLCGKTWFLRQRQAKSDVFGVKAYSNAAALTLTLNGLNAGTVPNGQYVLPNKTHCDNVFYWPGPLKKGRNDIVVDDGNGHTDTATVYFETGDQGLVRKLTSSNSANPAYFINQPVQAEWPVYYDFDGTGDNTFHAIPDILQGAFPITTKRLSNPKNHATITFTLDPVIGKADIFLMLTPTPAPPPSLIAGFTDTGIHGTWRDNAMNLIPYALYQRTAIGGETIRLPGATLDYAVFVKPQTTP